MGGLSATCSELNHLDKVAYISRENFMTLFTSSQSVGGLLSSQNSWKEISDRYLLKLLEMPP